MEKTIYDASQRWPGHTATPSNVRWTPEMLKAKAQKDPAKEITKRLSRMADLKSGLTFKNKLSDPRGLNCHTIPRGKPLVFYFS